MNRNRHRQIDLSERITRAVRLIGVVFLLIVIRIWHLGVVQHEERLEKSRRPQRRIVVERADRGTIRDRFNQPLAINKVQYNAAILYRDIQRFPRTRWRLNREGKKERWYPRREYIERLSQKLGLLLSMDPLDVEDQIYSRAALFHQIPYVLKRDITEEEYYRLKGLERQWLGMRGERVARREYPCGRVACDVVGYMGAIGKGEYDQIREEIGRLDDYLASRDAGEEESLPFGFSSIAEVKRRLHSLEEKAYRLDDFIGKSGIEGQFEKELRGYYGQKVYSSDARGNYLRELPGGREPVPGQRLLLSISSELQEFCEELLADNEVVRAGVSQEWNRKLGQRTPLLEPWIRGGAIVAMDPHNGEIVAMASHPRYDPNSFIPSGNKEKELKRQGDILRWFDHDRHIAAIWEGRRNLEREIADEEESIPLLWENYLNLLLPFDHPVRERLQQTTTLSKALLFLEQLEEPIEDSVEKLHVDLLRLVIDERTFPKELLSYLGDESISSYRHASLSAMALEREVYQMAKVIYHKNNFRNWRERYGKAYLRGKRLQEEEQGRYQRPYLDYFERLESKMFARFWEKQRWPLLLTFIHGEDHTKGEEHLFPYRDHLFTWARELESGAHQALKWQPHYLSLKKLLSSLPKEEGEPFLNSTHTFEQLTRPLIGRYPGLRNEKGEQQLKHLAAGFYPRYGFGYGRSYAYRQAAVQGSIFKLVTGYQALSQRYEESGGSGNFHDLNPLIILDQREKVGKYWRAGYFQDGRPIPPVYKGGRIIKSLSRNIGETDMLVALERSSNPYFSLLAGDYLDNPEDLNRAARGFGFGSRTGIELPGELAGRLPKDLTSNQSGLYSYAIGQHSLVVSPLQTAVMLSSLANGGQVLAPKILSLSAGKEPIRNPSDLLSRRNYPYEKALAMVGIDFPLFTEAEKRHNARMVEAHPTKVKREVDLPSSVRHILMEGMEKVVNRSKGAARGSLVHHYQDRPHIYKEFFSDSSLLVGKSSTAEARENVGIAKDFRAGTYNHVWFGGIAFSPPMKEPSSQLSIVKDKYGQPELVVVVYLRYGGMGHDATPLVTQVVNKWRSIQKNL